MARRRRPAATVVAAVVAVTLAAVTMAGCGGSSSGPGGGAGGGGTLVFGSASDPKTLDGAYVSDGESLRPIRQIFETLVTTKQGGTDIVPALAESWQPSADGLT